jgi:hypothetical protein
VGGVSQVVEHLPSKHEALNSTPQYHKINKQIAEGEGGMHHPALRRLKQKDREFLASLDYLVRPSQEKKKS